MSKNVSSIVAALLIVSATFVFDHYSIYPQGVNISNLSLVHGTTE